VWPSHIYAVTAHTSTESAQTETLQYNRLA
jgi:hypothetical protein